MSTPGWNINIATRSISRCLTNVDPRPAPCCSGAWVHFDHARPAPRYLRVDHGRDIGRVLACRPHAGANEPPPVPSTSTRVVALRPCASLVGKTTFSAILGGQVTCGFGGSDTQSHHVDVATFPCPNTLLLYVFKSTADDATDRSVYYGSTPGALYVQTKATTTLQAMKATGCVPLPPTP
jgi:hypothetical protein